MIIKNQKTNNIVLLITLLAVALAFLGYRLFTNNKDKSVTNFHDPSGWFYDCSRPIPAKWAVVHHLSGKSTKELVAANPQDVALYCHQAGIE